MKNEDFFALNLINQLLIALCFGQHRGVMLQDEPTIAVFFADERVAGRYFVAFAALGVAKNIRARLDKNIVVLSSFVFLERNM